MITIRRTEYWVEYDFINTQWGRRPNWIRTFKNEADAIAFAKTQPDANYVGEVKCESYFDED